MCLALTPESEQNYLVLVARPLAVLSQTLQGLVDKSYVLLVDVESEETEAPGCAPTDAVQKLQCLTHQVVVGLVILATKEILQRGMRGQRQREEGKGHPSCYLDCL